MRDFDTAFTNDRFVTTETRSLGEGSAHRCGDGALVKPPERADGIASVGKHAWWTRRPLENDPDRRIETVLIGIKESVRDGLSDDF